uniref:Uncharacterized protein n=1 Tax=Myoviridae sp. ctT1Q6 TaxID=2823546 RepID=A0A8S5LFD1_9CAUD|nr:MAG TPA: hypothetical protein [Myoviridae sp. ctT1Q6]
MKSSDGLFAIGYTAFRTAISSQILSCSHQFISAVEKLNYKISTI